MEPGSDSFNPIKYTLRIFKEPDRQMPLMYLQASTPFPSFQKGDILKSVSWSLGLEGRLVIVEEVHHSLFSVGQDAYCETHLFCRFPSET